MNRAAELHCTCGKVRGTVANASPSSVNRMVCYCDDCQAYLHHLGRPELMDAHGGTDVVQVAPAALSFGLGGELIAGLRLTPKGLYRWYARCCNTPLGNTLQPNVPFVGIVAQAFEGVDELFGRPVGAVQGKYAVGAAPEGSTGLNLKLIGRAARMVLGWKLRGQAWPHPFFERTSGTPRHPITVLSPQERAALRPLCGPASSARPASTSPQRL